MSARRALVLTAALLAGCASTDPSVPGPPDARLEAAGELAALESSGGRLRRPVILIPGWMDEPAVMDEVKAWIVRCAPADAARVRVFDLRGPGGLREAADRLAAELGGEEEVDVIGYSLGGLVAREAARECRGDRRLHVARLFGIATPHRGTFWGRLWGIAPQRQQLRDAKPGSVFLAELERDGSSRAMEIVSFWFEGDIVCTRTSALAEGERCLTYGELRGPRVHDGCIRDPRLVRDVVRTLVTPE